MDINTIKSVYFVGAGGIGMSALVRYFLSRGKVVGGYDKTPTELTQRLIDEGALIHYDENVDLIPEAFRSPEDTLVVYTPAIPAEHRELVYFRKHNFEIQKRAQVLGMLTRTEKGLCVAGTHGKTTTSTLAAHLLHSSSVGCNAFLGGISKNYGTNLLLSAESEYVVIEADEFDRSFHWLTPFATVITSTDSDHLDIYGTREAYLESFAHYTSLIREEGYLIVKKGIDLHPRVKDSVHTFYYGINEGDFHAENIRIGNGEIYFDYISPLGDIQDIQLGVPVYVNIENGIAAMALAQISGVTNDEIKSAMADFRGVDRRFDFKLKTPEHVVLSDYAHHPAELEQSIVSIRRLYSDRKITGIFQPHLYTRTRDFYKEFAQSLSLLDSLILLDIYPARELPIEGVSSNLIYDALRPEMEKTLCTKSELIDIVRSKNPEVLIILGAGDVDNFVNPIVDTLKLCGCSNE